MDNKEELVPTPELEKLFDSVEELYGETRDMGEILAQAYDDKVITGTEYDEAIAWLEKVAKANNCK